MTRPDRDTTGPGPAGAGAALTLDGGPIGEALAAVDRARAEIEHAKAAFRERRVAFAAVFQAELAGCAETGACRCAELLGPVVAELYWDHPTLRVSDIAAATGLSGEQIRRTAGPKRCEVPCRRCGSPTEVLQTRRTQPPHALCADCRPVARFGEVVDPGHGPLPPPPGEPPRLDPPEQWAGPGRQPDDPPGGYASW